MSDQETYWNPQGFAFDYETPCACCELPMDKHEVECFTENEYLAHAGITEAAKYIDLALQSLRDAAARIKLDHAALRAARALYRGVRIRQAVYRLAESLRTDWLE